MRFIGLFLLLSTTAGALVETADLSQVKPSAGTFVLIEVENTLFACDHQLGSEEWAESIGVPDTHLWHQILRQAAVRPIDRTVQMQVRMWQKQGVVVVGMTQKGRTMAHTLVGHLRDVDIDLARTAPDYELLTNGLLCGGANAISDMLAAASKPSEVVIISHKATTLHHLHDALAERGIPCRLVRLTLADDRTFDRALAEVQLDHFNKILSNEEAEVLLPRRAWYWQ